MYSIRLYEAQPILLNEPKTKSFRFRNVLYTDYMIVILSVLLIIILITFITSVNCKCYKKKILYKKFKIKLPFIATKKVKVVEKIKLPFQVLVAAPFYFKFPIKVRCGRKKKKLYIKLDYKSKKHHYHHYDNYGGHKDYHQHDHGYDHGHDHGHDHEHEHGHIHEYDHDDSHGDYGDDYEKMTYDGYHQKNDEHDDEHSYSSDDKAHVIDPDNESVETDENDGIDDKAIGEEEKSDMDQIDVGSDPNETVVSKDSFSNTEEVKEKGYAEDGEQDEAVIRTKRSYNIRTNHYLPLVQVTIRLALRRIPNLLLQSKNFGWFNIEKLFQSLIK